MSRGTGEGEGHRYLCISDADLLMPRQNRIIKPVRATDTRKRVLVTRNSTALHGGSLALADFHVTPPLGRSIFAGEKGLTRGMKSRWEQTELSTVDKLSTPVTGDDHGRRWKDDQRTIRLDGKSRPWRAEAHDSRGRRWGARRGEGERLRSDRRGS